MNGDYVMASESLRMKDSASGRTSTVDVKKYPEGWTCIGFHHGKFLAFLGANEHLSGKNLHSSDTQPKASLATH